MYYFLTLRALPREIRFEENEKLTEQVDMLWAETMPAAVQGKHVCLRRNELYALLYTALPQAEQAVQAAVAAFVQRCRETRTITWSEPYKLRRLVSSTDVSRARDFIVQCILNEELSDPGDDE